MTLSREAVFGGDEFLPKLVDDLEEKFPVYNPTPKDNLSMIMFRAGQREVIDYLKTLLPE